VHVYIHVLRCIQDLDNLHNSFLRGFLFCCSNSQFFLTMYSELCSGSSFEHMQSSMRVIPMEESFSLFPMRKVISAGRWYRYLPPRSVTNLRMLKRPATHQASCRSGIGTLLKARSTRGSSRYASSTLCLKVNHVHVCIRILPIVFAVSQESRSSPCSLTSRTGSSRFSLVYTFSAFV
jgi:hypothetical protein